MIHRVKSFYYYRSSSSNQNLVTVGLPLLSQFSNLKKFLDQFGYAPRMGVEMQCLVPRFQFLEIVVSISRFYIKIFKSLECKSILTKQRFYHILFVFSFFVLLLKTSKRNLPGAGIHLFLVGHHQKTTTVVDTIKTPQTRSTQPKQFFFNRKFRLMY